MSIIMTLNNFLDFSSLKNWCHYKKNPPQFFLKFFSKPWIFLWKLPFDIFSHLNWRKSSNFIFSCSFNVRMAWESNKKKTKEIFLIQMMNKGDEDKFQVKKSHGVMWFSCKLFFFVANMRFFLFRLDLHWDDFFLFEKFVLITLLVLWFIGSF
jgi:hypothetical protein